MLGKPPKAKNPVRFCLTQNRSAVVLLMSCAKKPSVRRVHYSKPLSQDLSAWRKGAADPAGSSPVHV